jgi:RNA polymerase sigma-70 factor (ECF subfamily)
VNYHRANVGDDQCVTSLSLLERARAWDQDAWDRLVTLYGPLIYDWCLKAHLQAADAEDIGQKVFEAVFRKLREFRRDRPGDTFRGWLHRITLNKIHDFHRQGARRPLTGFIQCLPLATPDAGPSNEDQLRENCILLYQALEMVQGEFSDKAWTAFHGVCIQGQAIADVAADMNTTPNAVSLAIGRVITRLRREFFDLLPDALILT